MGRYVDSMERLVARRISGQMGSNIGGLFESIDGKKNYLKIYRSVGQAYSEFVANNVYRALGVRAPESVMFDPAEPGQAQAGAGIANEYIDGWLLSNRCDVAKEVAEKILDGVAADILVANWDVIGLVNDNIVVENEGTPVRIDNGGSFMFRALGSLKPPAQLLAIDEWEYFSGLKKGISASTGSYLGIIIAAGYTTLDDIKPRIREQIIKINQVAKATGDFEQLVPALPGVDSGERTMMLCMLKERWKLLCQRLCIS